MLFMLLFVPKLSEGAPFVLFPKLNILALGKLIDDDGVRKFFIAANGFPGLDFASSSGGAKLFLNEEEKKKIKLEMPTERLHLKNDIASDTYANETIGC
jgi:hypothetical protein